MRKFLASGLILLGLSLIFTPFLSEQIIIYKGKNIDREDISMEKIRSNVEKSEKKSNQDDYDFSAIKDVDIISLIKGSLNFDKDLVVGLILIPDLDLELPIFDGLNDANLMAGAATMKANQIMGKGNYALSGHNMKNKKLLFGSLMDIEVGSKVFISNGLKLYEYKIYENLVVPDTEINMIYDEKAEKKGKPIISIMTCFHSSSTGKRFFSLGELVKEHPLEN